MSCDNDLCVKLVPMFSTLAEEKLAQINQLVQQESYAAGEAIFWEGEIGKNLYILNSGQIKIFKTSLAGKEYILRLLTGQEFFGEVVLFKEEPLSSSAQAVIDSKVCVISKQKLERLIKADPEISYHLLAAFSSRLKEAEQTMESLALEDAHQKTVRLLRNLAEQVGENKQEGIKLNLPLSRQGLANLIGVTQETLSRKLSALEAEGLIQIKGQKEIIVAKELVKLN